jgi:hypothetical protein
VDIDSDGTHALEMVTVNFEGCKQIGKLEIIGKEPA